MTIHLGKKHPTIKFIAILESYRKRTVNGEAKVRWISHGWEAIEEWLNRFEYEKEDLWTGRL